ncbi:MAG: DUF2058 family protein, partial [Candidatus Competibacteraceae bacterium]|nr:DUF2058 family protein [Candidatus Competibacteraceae bacterium]
MSLRDQLLKSGLVTKDKVKQVEADTRKQAHQAKKNKKIAAAEAAEQAQKRRLLALEIERKRERDRQLNREREADKKRREASARARQLMDSQRQNDSKAEICYNFLADERMIRYLRVTPQQQKQLAMGRLGIARSPENDYDYLLIPRETALKLAEIDSAYITVLHPETDRYE